MNDTPAGERAHISFFGRRNAGKSSLLNAVTGQELAVVSDIPGTTTDPVYKAMELLPLGPVMLIDTPGFDDEGTLGEQRVKKTLQILEKTDAAVLVVDAVSGLSPCDQELIALFKERNVIYIIAYNKSDKWDSKCAMMELPQNSAAGSCAGQAGAEGGSADFYIEETSNRQEGDAEGTETGEVVRKIKRDSAGQSQKQTELEENKITNVIYVSAHTGEGIHTLKERLASLLPSGQARPLAADLVSPMDIVVLVVPIDSAAPKGRLILPQQQTIRDLLEAGAVTVTVRESELAETLRKLPEKPAFVITDSQAFAEVAAVTPADVPLTSFSILMARYKGFLKMAVAGAAAIDSLRDGDRILIAEGCTHHRQCDDIGTVKLPRFLKQYTGKELAIETSSGTGFPEDLSPFALVIHCGGCMLNGREVLRRMRLAESRGVPVTNYGIAIAKMKGILKRSIAHVHV